MSLEEQFEALIRQNEMLVKNIHKDAQHNEETHA